MLHRDNQNTLYMCIYTYACIYIWQFIKNKTSFKIIHGFKNFSGERTPSSFRKFLFKRKERIFPQVSKPILLFNSPSTVVKSFSIFFLCQTVKVAISPGEECSI